MFVDCSSRTEKEKPTCCTTYYQFISSTSTCFGRIQAHQQEVQPYVYNNWYLLFFLDDCLLSTATCFGRNQAHHQEVQPYVYNSWYLLFFLDDCLLSTSTCFGRIQAHHQEVHPYVYNNQYLLYFLNDCLMSTSTCFGRIQAHQQEIQPYVYNNWYLLFFLDDCLLSWFHQDNRQSSKRIISTNCCIYTVVPPDDGPGYARNMQRLTKQTKSKLCSKFVLLYTFKLK